jgi:hypothetical protein
MDNKPDKVNLQTTVEGPRTTEAKVVAEMNVDEKIREEMKEMKKSDGFSDHCGGPVITNELSEATADESVDDAVQALTAAINKRDSNPDEC